MFRRVAIESVGGFDPSLGEIADLNLLLRIARILPIEFHDRPILADQDRREHISIDLAKMQPQDMFAPLNPDCRVRPAALTAPVVDRILWNNR